MNTCYITTNIVKECGKVCKKWYNNSVGSPRFKGRQTAANS